MAERDRKQARATQGIRARRGLTPMLAQQGADAETLEAAQLIESMPGGPELLYSYAAELAGLRLKSLSRNTPNRCLPDVQIGAGE